MPDPSPTDRAAEICDPFKVVDMVDESDGENYRSIVARSGREIAEALAAADPPLLVTPELTAELEHLRRWKAEAMQVLAAWEEVWLAAGQPGPIGSSKAANVRRFIEDMIASPDEVTPEIQAVLDEIVRIRAWGPGWSTSNVFLQAVDAYLASRGQP